MAKIRQTSAKAGGPSIPLAADGTWDDVDGQEYGGSAEILKLEVDQVAGPLEYQGHQEINTDLGTATVHLGADDDGNQWRLPIQATFIRCVDQAGLRRGDKFLVRRLTDQVKKRGKGAGNPMAIYAIKVVSRSVNVEEAAAAAGGRPPF